MPATARTNLLAVGFGPNPSEKLEWAGLPWDLGWDFSGRARCYHWSFRRLLQGTTELWRRMCVASEKVLVWLMWRWLLLLELHGPIFPICEQVWRMRKWTHLWMLASWFLGFLQAVVDCILRNWVIGSCRDSTPLCEDPYTQRGNGTISVSHATDYLWRGFSWRAARCEMLQALLFVNWMYKQMWPQFTEWNCCLCQARIGYWFVFWSIQMSVAVQEQGPWDQVSGWPRSAGDPQ